MRLQDSLAGCGPAAMHNALMALGTNTDMTICEKLCNTSAVSGTQPRKLLNALRGVSGLSCNVLKERSREDAAILKLLECLRLGRPAILCVDKGTHWVATVGILGSVPSIRVLVADSADLDLVISYTPGELLKRWGPPYYGIVL